MSADEGRDADMFGWSVELDHSGAENIPYVPPRTRRDEERAYSLALIVTVSLLFILIASALMVGGHAAIGPLVNRGTSAGQANSTGAVVYTMPDRVFCRRMTFDNATGTISKDTMKRCADASAGTDHSASTWFNWTRQ